MDDWKPRVAGQEQQDRVIGAIVLGFSRDPFARWAAPDADAYLAHFPKAVRALGGRAFGGRTAYETTDGAGAALWLAPGVEPDVEALMAHVESDVRPDRRPTLLKVLEAMGERHPKEPHWYLPLIAVDPICHGRGCGSALMRFALERIDRERLPAYLENSNPANDFFYERHGFERIDTLQIDETPPLALMYRPACNATAI